MIPRGFREKETETVFFRIDHPLFAVKYNSLMSVIARAPGGKGKVKSREKGSCNGRGIG